MENFLRTYNTERNETIQYKYKTSIKYAQANQDFIDVELILEVPPQTVLYQPKFWQVLKFAWVTYFAGVILLYVPLHRFFLSYVMKGGVFETV
jgi:hypothetical protein